MERSKSIEFAVGLFVVLGVIALLFVSLQAANLSDFISSGKTYTVNAYFDNIGGLKSRAPVKSAGVLVGRVTRIDFDPETFRARVVMDLKEDFKFPADSSAQIYTSGLLGEQFVNISAGAEDANLEMGSEIVQTQSAMVLENLIGQFMLQFAEKSGSSSDAE